MKKYYFSISIFFKFRCKYNSYKIIIFIRIILYVEEYLISVFGIIINYLIFDIYNFRKIKIYSLYKLNKRFGFNILFNNNNGIGLNIIRIV